MCGTVSHQLLLLLNHPAHALLQIRNTASLGGNIATGSPISDLNPLWMASRTTFGVAGHSTPPRTVAARTFFLGYRRL